MSSDKHAGLAQRAVQAAAETARPVRVPADPVAVALIADLARRHPTHTRAQLRRAFRKQYAAITRDLEGNRDGDGHTVE